MGPMPVVSADDSEMPGGPARRIEPSTAPPGVSAGSTPTVSTAAVEPGTYAISQCPLAAVCATTVVARRATVKYASLPGKPSRTSTKPVVPATTPGDPAPPAGMPCAMAALMSAVHAN